MRTQNICVELIRFYYNIGTIELLETVPFIKKEPVSVYKNALEAIYNDLSMRADNSLSKLYHAEMLEP